MDVNIMLEKGELMGLIKISEREVHYSHLDKTYRADPEELVRAATYVYLCSDLEYPPSRIELEVVPLRRDPSNPADIIVYSDDELNSRFIVCEIKAESTPGDIEQAKRQGLGNANLQGSHYLLCVCDTEELAYNVSSQPSLRNLEHYRVAQLPVSYGQAPTYRYVKGGAPDFELRRLELHELINKFDRAHQALWQAGRLDSLTAFDEMSKIMFAKLFDEIHTPAGEPYHCQMALMKA